MTQRIIRIALAFLSLCSFASADPVSMNEIRVKDGDTIYYRNDEFRMIGYDAPETKRVRWRYVSKDEMALGEVSKARLAGC
jgi:endonuclease YncB( thermonuclease family)